MIVTQGGMIIRCPTRNVRAIGRATQGVRLISLEEGDCVVAVAKVPREDHEEPEDQDRARAG